jgi:hypothetical protein
MALVKGVAYWAKVFSLDTTYEPKWTIDVEVSPEDAEVLKGHGMEPRTGKGCESGLRFQFKRKLEKRDGSEQDPPIVVDKNNRKTKDIIGNGSEVIIQFRPYDWEYKKKTGKGCDLQGVKVTSLVTYGAKDGAEFGEIEEDLPENDPFV